MSRLKRKTHRIVFSTKKRRYLHGRFIPDNPSKYVGNVNNIIFRSSWELTTFEFCDDNANVLRWSSEEIAIPYVKPVFVQPFYKVTKYYPDLYVEYLSSKGAIIKEMIEIKPLKQTKSSRSRKTKNRIIENATFMVNQAKWKAAEEWCIQRRIRFKLMTERDIFN